MAPSVTGDIFENASLTEHAGEVTGADTVIYIKDVVDAPVMFTALDDPNVPKVGDALNEDRAPNVKLTDRHATGSVKQGDGNGYTIRIQLKYELKRKDPRPTRGGTSLTQIRTTRYPKNNAPHNEIIVTHDGISQRGEVSVLVPQTTIVMPITRSVKDPDAFAKFYVGKVNYTTWRNEPIASWLCTRCDWELSKTKKDPTRDTPDGEPEATEVDEYVFEFEFEQSSDDQDGWQTTVQWRDKTDTNRVGQNLLPEFIGREFPPHESHDLSDKGQITFLWYELAEFNTDFPFTPSGAA